MWYRLLGALFILLSFYHGQHIHNYFSSFLQKDVEVIPGLVHTSKGFAVVGTNEELLNCSPVDIVESVGEGWQKSVFRSATNYAIKKPRLDGPTFIECLERLSGERCRQELLTTLVNEILWFTRLQKHPGVIQMISYCIPSDVLTNIESVKVVVELGQPLTTLFLIQLPWNSRRDIVLNILEIVHSLREYTMNDFRRQQFVMVNGEPKLADLDHLTSVHQNETIILYKFQKEFLPFLTTSDAPAWFLNGLKDVSTTAMLLKILNGGLYECKDKTCK